VNLLRPRPWFVLLMAGLVTAGLTLGAQAAPPLAEVVVSTPNRINPCAGDACPLPPLETLLGTDEQFWVKVGPPEASLSVSVIEPRDKARPAKATVLVIHGIFGRAATMIPAAKSLADAGYRAVLVDLRGHGRSTGKYMTYGIQESKDLCQVIDELQRRKLAEGPLGVYGISYGAATSIHLAGRDPRIRAVVAVEPFSAARDEVPHFGRVMVPGIGILISEKTYQKALDEGGRIAQFDPDEADAVEAIRRTSAQVLLVHGTNDWVVPQEQSRRLHEAAADHSQLITIPWQGHTARWFDPGGKVAAHARDWFDRWLIPQPAKGS